MSMNKLEELFAKKQQNILNIYCTAGFPKLDSTAELLLALQHAGADIIELGIPYSDPVADGPVIQQSNMQALQNGMTIGLLFEQLAAVKDQLHLPVVLMGYINPVLQYGVERFCEMAAACGVAGIILPDLPMYEFEKNYRHIFKQYGLHAIFLISPHTSKERIQKADALSNGFLYAVSSSSVTGTVNAGEDREEYFRKIKNMKLRNPVLIGFGIRDKAGFEQAARYAAGGIIGTAFISHIAAAPRLGQAAGEFIAAIRGN